MKKILLLIVINLITLSRLVGSCFIPHIYKVYGCSISCAVCLILFLTDCIDGMLARKTNNSTFFGSLCDATSDKLLSIISLSILFTINKNVIYLIIVEVLIALVNLLSFIFNGNAQSSKIGKIKTILLGFTVVGIFVFVVIYGSSPLANKLTLIFTFTTLVLSIITLFDYSNKMVKSFILWKSKYKKEKLKLKSFKQFFFDLFNTNYFKEYKDKSYKYLIYSVK